MKKRLLLALLASGLMLSWTGCTTVKLIDPNKTTVRVLKGQLFNPPVDGYFVPDARMRENLDLLTEKDVSANPK